MNEKQLDLIIEARAAVKCGYGHLKKLSGKVDHDLFLVLQDAINGLNKVVTFIERENKKGSSR